MTIDADKYVVGEGTPFFKGKEIKGERINVKIKAMREAVLPNSGATLVLDFDYLKKERSLALNKTNVKKLKAAYGSDAEKWVGKEIKLKKVLVTNPKTKEEVESVRIETSVQKKLPLKKKKR